MRCDVCVLCGGASAAARCRVFASWMRALASVHAVERPSNISANGVDENADQSLACATRAINMFLT